MTSKTTNRFSPEVCARAVRMVLDHEAEVDAARRAGVSTDMAAKLKVLERENRELRQANEILRKASAYFALAELDRRSKR